MKAYFGGLRTLAVLSIGVFAAVASAQNAGDPGFFLRAIDSGGTINSLDTHDNVLGVGPVNGITETTTADVADGFPIIDFAGGPWPDNNAWFHPYTEDFVVTAIADVTIPAGHWGVGWGSDDGGQLTIPGVEFVTSYEQNAGEDFYAAADIIGSDRLFFDGNRGYRASFGSFSLDEPLETQINVSMWERGGGDNFEVFYIDLNEVYDINADELTNTEQDRPTPDNEWDLLGDEEAFSASWNVRIPAEVPAIAIPVGAGQTLNGTAENVEKMEVGEVKPGLLHYWYGRNNPGSLEGVSEFYDINAGPLEEADIAAFNPENTWWTGNQAALEGGTTDAPKYPAEIIDQARIDGSTFNGNDNSNYTVALSGEIRFPRDGEYVFTDGVDDLTVLAIDVNRDGEFDTDPEGGEILINDNAWTNLQRDANNGGFPGEYVPITVDVPDDCDTDNPSEDCWYRIEALFGEGGGTDAGIIYWNENSDVEFPTENGDGRVIAAEDIPELAIPEDHLRAPGGVVITSANLAASLNGEFPYEFEINEDGTFDSLTVNRSVDVATTSLDLNGATINLIANGDLSGLSGELQLLGADSISGELTVNVPEGLAVDTSRLASEGVLVFGDGPVCDPGTGADINGDGSVGFPDFLILSANFGETGLSGASHELGDLDCSGDVAFADFLALSNAFGNTVGAEAASVPEPSTVTLLGLGALALGLVRRRRK